MELFRGPIVGIHDPSRELYKLSLDPSKEPLRTFAVITLPDGVSTDSPDIRLFSNIILAAAFEAIAAQVPVVYPSLKDIYRIPLLLK